MAQHYMMQERQHAPEQVAVLLLKCCRGGHTRDCDERPRLWRFGWIAVEKSESALVLRVQKCNDNHARLENMGYYSSQIDLSRYLLSLIVNVQVKCDFKALSTVD